MGGKFKRDEEREKELRDAYYTRRDEGKGIVRVRTRARNLRGACCRGTRNKRNKQTKIIIIMIAKTVKYIKKRKTKVSRVFQVAVYVEYER